MNTSIVRPAASLPLELAREMRSNHAGETGAVWIYRGVLAVSSNAKIRSFALHHLETEERHLQFFEGWLEPSQKSWLLPIWRLSGWVLGAVAAAGGPVWTHASIEAVETFVVKHYEAQFSALADHGDEELTAAIHLFAADEASHRDEAAADDSKQSLILRAWCWIVGFGSEQAVKIARML